MIPRPFNVIHYVIIIVNLVHGELVLPKLLETFQCQARVKVSVCSFKSLHRYVILNLKLSIQKWLLAWSWCLSCLEPLLSGCSSVYHADVDIKQTSLLHFCLLCPLAYHHTYPWLLYPFVEYTGMYVVGHYIFSIKSCGPRVNDSFNASIVVVSNYVLDNRIPLC